MRLSEPERAWARWRLEEVSTFRMRDQNIGQTEWLKLAPDSGHVNRETIGSRIKICAPNFCQKPRTREPLPRTLRQTP